jgi:ABC-type transporter Mla subunit MlaD
MQSHKNEIATGVLVLLTAGVLLAALVVIGMPGLLHPMHTFRVYYDNAAGIRPGAPVLLAGREIGRVIKLESPIPLSRRPAGHEDFEVCIHVRVSAEAGVYNTATARLAQQGLMGQQVVDFIQGDEFSGLAADNQEFVGERLPELSEAMNAHMNRLTGPDSDLSVTVRNARTFMETLNRSEIPQVISNARTLTETLKVNTERMTGRDSDLAATIASTRQVMATLEGSDLAGVIRNSEQATDTLKREPWRLLWPVTKRYAGEEARAAGEPAKPRRAKSAAGPTPPLLHR